MIFQRSLLREFGNYASAVFAALFAIVVTSQLVRMLGSAAGGKIPTDAIIALIGFTSVNYVPILLALTLFVSILMTVSRSYRDSEMVIWSTAGLPLTAWIRPALIFAAPLLLLIALLSLFLSPWAYGQMEDYRRRLDNRDEVSRVAPGVFRESANAERVFFVESVAGAQGTVKNVFIAGRQHGREGVMVSKEGYIETAANGDRFAILLNGNRYEWVPETGEYRVMAFERYAARIETNERQASSRSAKASSTLELIGDRAPGSRAELMWRIGLPLVALNLALLAIPLSFVNPRATRSVNLLFAIFAYMTYTNLLSVVQAWVAQGKVRFEVGWWVLHAAMLVLIAVLFLYRDSLGFSLLKRR